MTVQAVEDERPGDPRPSLVKEEVCPCPNGLKVLISSLVLALGSVLVPQFVRPALTAAQTVAAGSPVAVCGTVSSYTAATATTAGTITLSTPNVNATFAIAPGATVSGGTGLATGTDICLSAAADSSSNLTTLTFTPNTGLNAVFCGTVGAFVPATTTSTGLLTIAGATFSLALGTAFTGSTLTVGTDACVTATLNGLGEINGGTVSASGSSTPTGTPISFCGTVSSFTAPTAGAAGSVTLSGLNANVTFAVAAGTTIAGSSAAPATGDNICLVGVTNAAGALISATLTPNATSQASLCGTVVAFTPATATSLGSLTIGSTTVAVGLNTVFTGEALTVGSNLCLAGTFNGLGSLISGVAQTNTTPTATAAATSPPGPPTTLPTTIPGPPAPPTPSPTVTPTAAPTDTPTATVAPTATSAPPVATDTPTPKPKPAAKTATPVPTATSAPAAPTGNGPPPKKKTAVVPAVVPQTGAGGTAGGSGSVSLSSPPQAAPAGHQSNTTITTLPQTGGGDGGNPASPLAPLALLAAVAMIAGKALPRFLRR